MHASQFAVALFLVAAVAHAEEDEQVQKHLTHAQASYALGEWAEAAREFETTFKLAPRPALLYNAATSHRMAGNKARAVLLYTNYLRVYGRSLPRETRTSVTAMIQKLEEALAVEKNTTQPATVPTVVPTSPPDEPPPPATTTPPTTPTTPPPLATDPGLDSRPRPPEVTPPSVSVTTPTATPLAKRPALWFAVGGAVVVIGVGAGAGTAVALQPRAPAPQNRFVFDGTF
jgi:hypothetical protein